MNRSISIVEYKVQQAEFFLGNLASVGFDLFAAGCFADSFAWSARSITLAMQAVMGEVDGFSTWYLSRQEALKQDPLARFFLEFRNVSSHIGDTVVRSGASRKTSEGQSAISLYFLPIQDIKVVPDEDVLTACTLHFRSLLQIVFDSMVEFKYAFDDRWYFTVENFDRMGKSLGDAMAELGFPPTWLDVAGEFNEDIKWRTLRKTQTIGCQLNGEFRRYLGKVVLGPDDCPE